MALEISSVKNPRVRQLVELEKPRERRLQGLFVVEGVREVSLALQSGFTPRSLFICPTIYTADAQYPVDLSIAENVLLTENVYVSLAVREGTGGIIGLMEERSSGLDGLPVIGRPLYIVLEKVEKPGNIGAILRTADAAGANGVIVCDPATDFHNPNVIRSSVGCVFTVPIACAPNEEVHVWLRQRGVRSFAAALTPDATAYHTHGFTEGTAFILGSESDGLSDFWLRNVDEKVIIPMHGRIDSMNVSNAAAVLVFEALRQRGL